MASHSHAKLDEEHRCIAAKCKGRLHDPPESYGRYAYWRNGPAGWKWYATPSKSQEKKKRDPKVCGRCGILKTSGHMCGSCGENV